MANVFNLIIFFYLFSFILVRLYMCRHEPALYSYILYNITACHRHCTGTVQYHCQRSLHRHCTTSLHVSGHCTGTVQYHCQRSLYRHCTISLSAVTVPALYNITISYHCTGTVQYQHQLSLYCTVQYHCQRSLYRHCTISPSAITVLHCTISLSVVTVPALYNITVSRQWSRISSPVVYRLVWIKQLEQWLRLFCPIACAGCDLLSKGAAQSMYSPAQD